MYNDWIFDKEVIKMSNQKYTIEFKKQVVEFYPGHHTVKECSVTQSFATPGIPTENAVWEAFFSRMKYEALYRQTYLSIEEIDEEVRKNIDYYNNCTPHRCLNFKSPADVETAYYESLKA